MNKFEKGLSKLEQELRIDEEKLPASYFLLNQKQKNELWFWAIAGMNVYINAIRNAERLDNKDYNLKMMLKNALGLTEAEKEYLNKPESRDIKESLDIREKQELEAYYETNKDCIKGNGYNG